MNLSPKRAENLSIVGFFLQLLFFLLTLLVAIHANSLAVKIEAWHFLGGTLVWFMLILQFHQRRLAQEEKFDTEHYERLRREGKDTSVFEGTGAEENLQLSQRRLLWMEKYLIPIFSALLCGYLLGIGYWLYSLLAKNEAVKFADKSSLLASAVYLVGLALVSFLMSRYAVGMSQESNWRPLRAGGSYLFSNALACFALAIILLVVRAEYEFVEKYVAYVLVAIMVAIGVEILLNLILDAYRPRLKGQYRRAAYESRLLDLFCEPGGLVRSAAHALDYQFGFKVSETWFFKLIFRAFIPLVVVQIVILYLAGCLLMVEPGSVAVIERWGKPLIDKTLPSGLHVKWPWPIDIARSFPVEQLQIIDIGFKRFEKEEENKPILWTQEHWEEEYPFLVAVSEQKRQQPHASVAADISPAQNAEHPPLEINPEGEEELSYTDFDMLVVALTVHYRINNYFQYGYGSERFGYTEPNKLLESVCYRELVHYAARSDIEKLFGPGREQTASELKEKIQDWADQNELGIIIEFVGLVSVHPPIEVAESFENVVSALQQKQSQVLEARGIARQVLAQARGESEVLQYEADAGSFQRSQIARADSERFRSQLKAYQQGGDVYLWREYLSVLDEYVPALRKYVLASDQVDSWVYEFDLKEKLQPDLFEGLGLPEEQQESKK